MLPASDSNLVIRELLALQKENKELRRALGQKRGPRSQKPSSKQAATGLQPSTLPTAIERALQDAHQMIQAITSADKAELFKDYEATKRFVKRWQGLLRRDEPNAAAGAKSPQPQPESGRPPKGDKSLEHMQSENQNLMHEVVTLQEENFDLHAQVHRIAKENATLTQRTNLLEQERASLRVRLQDTMRVDLLQASSSNQRQEARAGSPVRIRSPASAPIAPAAAAARSPSTAGLSAALTTAAQSPGHRAYANSGAVPSRRRYR